MSTIIKTENLAKAYQLGQFSTGTISKDIERWWAMMRGKEDPFLKIGETNDRASKGSSDIVWSLKDVSFEVQQGEALGIIGRNGAGKSTLLKLLSRVTSPTRGEIKIKGRVASLLEVGTGFHPELTGRENIFLNGTILGMRKKEIQRNFDEIVDFAGVERYIDTPVKRYSSGMYVRLAFGVAAYLESEILIVDEVLAVGDAEFQKKCLGKMEEVSSGAGRTVLFVSHNMSSIASLCKKVLVLNKGIVDFQGNTTEGIERYLQKTDHVYLSSDLTRLSHYGPRSFANLLSIELFDKEQVNSQVFYKGDPLEVAITMQIHFDVQNVEVGIAIITQTGQFVLGCVSQWEGVNFNFNAGTHTVKCVIKELNLVPNTYSVSPWIKYKNAGVDDQVDGAISFEVEESGNKDIYFGYEKYNHLNFHQASYWSTT